MVPRGVKEEEKEKSTGRRAGIRKERQKGKGRRDQKTPASPRRRHVSPTPLRPADPRSGPRRFGHR